MRLDSVYIKNYRCFEEVELDLDERLTLLVGEKWGWKNGSFGCSCSRSQYIPGWH